MKICQPAFKQDLVFSLRRIGLGLIFVLRRITIFIPFDKPTDNRSTLIDHYDGTDATMISKFGSNVFATLRAADNNSHQDFVISVVPRTHKTEMK